MSSTDLSILSDVKYHINCGNLQEIQHIWETLQESEFDEHPDWVFLFQKIYLHACLKKHSSIAEWLQTCVFPRMDPIQQIALRQVFSYGRYLLHKP
jgi:hypothetical protein